MIIKNIMIKNYIKIILIDKISIIYIYNIVKKYIK
jgi:hypothetical protein